MVSEKLQKARDFEGKYIPYVPASKRPAFHVTGGIGWINAPTDFPSTRGNIISSFSITPIPPNGAPCTGGT